MEEKNDILNENNEVLENEKDAAAASAPELATLSMAEAAAPKEGAADAEDEEENIPLDKNIKLMSPTQMVIRRFFRSKLSIIGLIMVVGLFLFSFVGPLFFADLDYSASKNDNDGKWGEIELDDTPSYNYTQNEITYTDENGVEHTVMQTVVVNKKYNSLAPISKDHILGTDQLGYDVFTRLMYGGRISLSVSFIAVFVITVLGVVLGGIAGYFGGVIDNIIMRICDILMCLPGIPILLIISTLLEAADVDMKYRIYWLMVYLTLFSWPGTARLVRGQILSLREQEYMIAAEAMGYSTPRKIFKHLVPNVMPQLIVQMTLSLGSMILYEATLSYLNMGVKAPYAAWGTMINIISTDMDILQNNFNVWGAPGICIIIAVLGFNFVGDGLRDALDPKMRR